MEDRDELLRHYESMRQELVDATDGLSDELMTEASIDGWSVKDHLAHIALWDEIRAAEVTRISAGYASAWRMTDEQDEGFNALSYELRRDLSLEQVLWEFEVSRRRLIEAIRGATPDGLDASRYGAAGLRSSHEAEHAGWIRRWRGEKGLQP